VEFLTPRPEGTKKNILSVGSAVQTIDILIMLHEKLKRKYLTQSSQSRGDRNQQL
jgi:hypothetical protein